jgi:hypothetical protein
MANLRKNRSRKNRRILYGGQAPLNWNSANVMPVSLAQGNQFADFHKGQHGGMSAYPGGVVGSMLPANLADSARVSPTLAAYKEISGLQDGGRRKNSRKNRKNRKGSRKNRKGSRKNRKGSRKNRRQNGGDFVRWGGGGGLNLGSENLFPYGDVSKMLISPQAQAQAGLHPEWKDAQSGAWYPKQ